ncbi:MAG: hypothetical protein HeimC3_28330 [Candidatus Heimdallarchaeota archaeon LC_3]|nr:MAG: hypothetical protein HeimC3_28330 [Candidatus Heimdallarchaeota archaeon LC_3]
MLNSIKLARKRKKNVSQIIADEFFSKHSKWRSNKSSDDIDISYSTSHMETTQPSSNRAQTQSETSIQQSQITVANRQNNQQHQPTYASESESQSENNIESTSPELKPSNLFTRRDSVSQQEIGTFGLDKDSSTDQSQLERKDRPILFDQLSNALDKSDSDNSSGISESLRSVISTENIINQKVTVPIKQEKDEIDQLSTKIGSLLQEAKSLKADKELKRQQELDKEANKEILSKELLDIKKSDITISQLDSEVSEESESKISIQDQIADKLSDSDLEKQELPESDQKFHADPSQQVSIAESSSDSISDEDDTSSSMAKLRTKINEVMNITNKLDQDNEEFFDSKSIEDEFSETKESSLPIFNSEINSKSSSEQLPIIKVRTQSKTPLNKEKLSNVLDLLKEDEKSSLKEKEESRIDESEIILPFEEIKDVKIKISRKFVLNPSDDSLNIELKFDNNLDNEYSRDYIISHVSPEGWKIDQPKIYYQKDKKTDKRKVKLLLKGPLIEWRLSAGKFE